MKERLAEFVSSALSFLFWRLPVSYLEAVCKTMNDMERRWRYFLVSRVMERSGGRMMM